MRLSEVARSVSGSVTLKLNQTAAQLKAAGEPVIHLGGGEPLSKTPPSAIDAAKRILDTGEIRYGPEDGIAPLKEAIVDYTRRFYGRNVGPEHVAVSAGVKQAAWLTLQAVLDPGDEVILPAPYWVSYPDMARLLRAKPAVVTPADGSLCPTIGEIERALTPRTRAVILNTPNNPAGVMYDEAFIGDVVRLCERCELWLLLDDLYHRQIFDGRRPVSAYDYARAGMDETRIVVLNGVSKQFAMTGFRVGWSVANPELRKAIATMQGHETSAPSMVSQHAALGALRGPQDSVEALRLTLEAHRTIAVEALRAIEGVKLTPPGGTFFCFPDFRAIEADSMKLAQMLLERVKVVVVPGVAFGMDGFLRISTCGSETDIREGIARIRWALDPQAPREIQIGGHRFMRNW